MTRRAFFNLTRLPAVKERLKRGDASVLMEQDGFQPLGKIPAVPPVCPPPKYIAKILGGLPRTHRPGERKQYFPA